MVERRPSAADAGRTSRPGGTPPDHKDPAALDRCFQALADPTRRAVIERLARGDATLGELAEPLPMSLPAVQKHVRVLEAAGLVETAKVGRSRHCRLRAAPMKQAVDYMQRYRMFWDERLDALGELLASQDDTHDKEERT